MKIKNEPSSYICSYDDCSSGCGGDGDGGGSIILRGGCNGGVVVDDGGSGVWLFL